MNPKDAVASRLIETLELASGIGSSCVLQPELPWLSSHHPNYNPSCLWLADRMDTSHFVPHLSDRNASNDAEDFG